MKVSSISQFNNNQIVYRSSKKRSEYVQQKKDYLDIKTKKLDEISLATLILGAGARIVGNTDVIASKNLSGTSSRVGNGFIVVSFLTFIASMAKKLQLANEFDKMNLDK